MDEKKIFIFLIIIALIFTYNIVLGSQKICIRINVDNSYADVKYKIKNLFCNIATCNGQIEYEENDLVILGGNNILLPTNRGNINMQCCLKEHDDGCTLILAYPALPLESY